MGRWRAATERLPAGRRFRPMTRRSPTVGGRVGKMISLWKGRRRRGSSLPACGPGHEDVRAAMGTCGAARGAHPFIAASGPLSELRRPLRGRAVDFDRAYAAVLTYRSASVGRSLGERPRVAHARGQPRRAARSSWPLPWTARSFFDGLIKVACKRERLRAPAQPPCASCSLSSAELGSQPALGSRGAQCAP